LAGFAIEYATLPSMSPLHGWLRRIRPKEPGNLLAIFSWGDIEHV
jgi:hypothetical protein